MPTLLLKLGGPLQSWGSDSYFDERRTDPMPTKSGVAGLVAAALGRGREDDISDITALRFGVRIDQPGRVIDDLHITQMPGKLQSNLSHRKYLSDALFVAGLEGEEHFLKEIHDALMVPYYPLFLGRRSCPPAEPVSLGLRGASLYDALRDEPWQASEWIRRRTWGEQQLRIVMDSNDRNSTLKHDFPVSFSAHRREYTYRGIEEAPPATVVAEEKGAGPDFFAAVQDCLAGQQVPVPGGPGI